LHFQFEFKFSWSCDIVIAVVVLHSLCIIHHLPLPANDNISLDRGQKSTQKSEVWSERTVEELRKKWSTYSSSMKETASLNRRGARNLDVCVTF
jgi:hypothetical protein